jgi:hypothetical protein
MCSFNQEHYKHVFLSFVHILYAKGVGGSIESLGQIPPT